MRQYVGRGVAVVIAVGLGLGVTPAEAADGKVAIGMSAGTLGVGPELSVRFTDHLGVRVGAELFDYDDSDTLDDIDYDVKLKLNSFGATLDVYPFGGGFRVSVGARSNNNKIRLLGAPTTAVQIGDVTYQPSEVGTLSGTIETDSFAPVVSIGYGGRKKPGFGFGLEVGAMKQGSPKISNLQASGTLASNSAFQAELAKEQARIEGDASDYKYWPVLQLQLFYRF